MNNKELINTGNINTKVLIKADNKIKQTKQINKTEQVQQINKTDEEPTTITTNKWKWN